MDRRSHGLRQAGCLRRGWRLATFRDVELRLHVSLVVLLVYVVLMSTAQFRFAVMTSGVDTELLTGTALSWGLLFALSLFISVTLHEFGHVVSAQRMGVRVRSVLLMMLGGISRMERVPERPYAEARMAIAGPLVSFGLAAVFLLVGRLTESTDLQFYGYWMGRTNLALGIFNLLPVFPLDGGRVMRSLLAERIGFEPATYYSVQMARVMAWAIAFYGLLSFNLVPVLIALFVRAIATRERVAIAGPRRRRAGTENAPPAEREKEAA